MTQFLGGSSDYAVLQLYTQYHTHMAYMFFCQLSVWFGLVYLSVEQIAVQKPKFYYIAIKWEINILNVKYSTYICYGQKHSELLGDVTGKRA